MIQLINKNTKEVFVYENIKGKCELYYSEFYPVFDATLIVNDGEFKHWFQFVSYGNVVDNFE